MKKRFLLSKAFFAIVLFFFLCAGITVTAEAASSSAVCDGIDYSPVYNYSYYVKRHPKIKKKYKGNKAKILRYYVKNGFPKKEKARAKVPSGAFDRISQERIAKALSGTETSQKTGQIILVVNHELSLWEKQKSGTWKRRMKAYCGYGKNGFSSDRHEGDMTTPVGSFPILHAFGTARNPSVSMTWKRITKYSYWSGRRKDYNTWVESRKKISGEHLIDYYQYEYAMAIGFNRDPVVYKKGSAIFLHCRSRNHWYTAGCVSVTKKNMKKLLRYCKDGTYILIVPKESRITDY